MSIETTFILGAGSSAVYDFPVGKELLAQVKKSLNLEIVTTDIFRGPSYYFEEPGDLEIIFEGQNISEIVESIQKLEVLMSAPFSAKNSIDSWVSSEHVSQIPHGPDIIKTLIVKIINQYEQGYSERLTNNDFDEVINGIGMGDPSDDWLEYFVTYFLAGKSHSELSRIKIINFNYDRIFDNAIYNHLKFINKDHSKIIINESNEIKTIGGLEIVHPYGKLGEIDGTPIGSLTQNKFYEAAKNIDLIRDDAFPNQAFQRCRNILHKSNQIVFLGFGFDLQNMKHLGYSVDGSNINYTQKTFFNPYRLTINEVEKNKKLIGRQTGKEKIIDQAIDEFTGVDKEYSILRFLRSTL